MQVTISGMRFYARWVWQESVMLITDIKLHKGSNIGYVGLALIGEMVRVSGLDTLVDRMGPGKAPQIKEREIFAHWLVSCARAKRNLIMSLFASGYGWR